MEYRKSQHRSAKWNIENHNIAQWKVRHGSDSARDLQIYISVLTVRFCEIVGFFSGTDKATAEGGTSLGGSGGMLPQNILKIAMQIEPFYNIWVRICYISPVEN